MISRSLKDMRLRYSLRYSGTLQKASKANGYEIGGELPEGYVFK
jgi:hypothetical protein